MINKIYKRIHNKYSTLFKFLFFLRHLVAIFFLSIVLFLSVPYFFDFKKKDEIIKNYLLENYNLKLNKYDDIKYNFFPIPNLDILNTSNTLNSTMIKLDVKNIRIYPKLISIYNFKKFKVKKIILNKNELFLRDDQLKFTEKFFFKSKNKIKINNLELKIFKDSKLLININKINFTNYGYKKNIITGQVFGKWFTISLNENNKRLNLRLINTGINIDLVFNEIKKKELLNGIIKAKILNSKLRFNFEHGDNLIKINNLHLRSKNLSFNHNGLITYQPFFSINSKYTIEEINRRSLRKLNIKNILNSKNILKKFNSHNEIIYKSKKFSRSVINDLNLKINLNYGRIFYTKKLIISDHLLNCKGDSNLLEEYPILYFDCFIESKNKKNLFKKFSISYKKKNEPIYLNFKGRLNILNKKINFTSILMNKNYKASKEDLNYFKGVFEDTLFDENFLDIFDTNKIRSFIKEVS